MRRIGSVRAIGAVAIVSLLAAGLIATAQAQPKPGGVAAASPGSPYKPVQSLHHMMEGQNKLLKEIKAGIIDKALKDAMVSAWILAEISNSNQYQNEDPAYRELAVRVSQQCVELAQTLKKGDEKAAMTQLNAIGQTCGACHDKFKKD